MTARILILAMEGELCQQLLAGVAAVLKSVRLRQLGQRLIQVNLQLLVWQLCKLAAEVPVCELLHVTLVIPRNFLSLHSFIEEVSIEFAHQPEASPQEVAVLLEKFGVVLA